MFGFERYNYETFTREMMDKHKEQSEFNVGPKPGVWAPDFEGRTLDGDKMRLSDFRGRGNVVLYFGSATCPMTAGSIRGMNALYRQRGDDAEFLFIYVREAHPGDQIPAHHSMDDKVRAAELLRYREDLEMPIVVDDLRGSIHRKYGKVPNPTYIIDRSGRVAFRSMWTRPTAVGAALRELQERQEERGVDHAIVHGGEDRVLPISYPLLFSYRALERGGRKAIEDFERALGIPGTVAVTASRLLEPIATNQGRILAGTVITGAVAVAALLAGRKLRQRRFRSVRGTDELHQAPTRLTGTDDQPVGR